MNDLTFILLVIAHAACWLALAEIWDERRQPKGPAIYEPIAHAKTLIDTNHVAH